MGGYLLSGFNKALILTGALNKGAAQRIAETGKWWIDCTEHGGMEKHAAGYRSTLHVRMVHAMVRRHLPKNPEWKNEEYGLPVNQIDMVATYLAFGPVMLVGMRALGIPVLPRDSRAVMHLWKYAGWLMGVEDKWLVDDEREGLALLYKTYMTQSVRTGPARSWAMRCRWSRWSASCRRLPTGRACTSCGSSCSTSST